MNQKSKARREKKFHEMLDKRMMHLTERELYLDTVKKKEIELLEKDKELKEREKKALPSRGIEIILKQLKELKDARRGTVKQWDSSVWSIKEKEKSQSTEAVNKAGEEKKEPQASGAEVA